MNIKDLVRKVGAEPDYILLKCDELERLVSIVKAETLEEAARECETLGNTEANMSKAWRNGCFDCGDTIRNLIK